MKERIGIFLFVFILFSISILGLFIKDRDVSSFERRKLMSASELDDDFFGNIDEYMTDQFPFRDLAISVSSIYNRYILNNYESNDVYVVNDYMIEKNEQLDEASVNGFVEKINYINNNYLMDSNNVYYTIIPDKGYFLDGNKYLKIDYDELFSRVNNGLNLNYIDMLGILKLEDYYKTDIHIKQDSYFKVLDELDKHLDFGYISQDYERKVYDKFYGGTYSKVSLGEGDILLYLTNEDIENARVWHFDYGEKSVYDEDELYGVDAYNVFLSGPSGLIEITNENISDERELVVFRDSFASSLVPLLVPYYSKITMIDLRYMSISYVSDYVNFEDKDVIFIYSTLNINNSNILKVNYK